MHRHTQIHAFSLPAHRAAVGRSGERPTRLNETLGVIARWREPPGSVTYCDPHWTERSVLLTRGVEAVEQAVCAETDHAEVLRNVSPLGRFVSPAERKMLLLQQGREAA